MAQKTSINIKPCNVGSSSPHNRRSAEYLANIHKEKLYIRTDLMAKNEAWVAPELGDTSLADRYKQIAAMVKEKTGRAMQTKDRERVNKKTGKVTIVRGSTPLKEGVVVIKEDTTMKQLQNFCEVCKQRGYHSIADIHSQGRGALHQSRRHCHMEAQPARPHRMGLDEPRHREILQIGRESHERNADTISRVFGNGKGHFKEADG